ncbi:MAG: hypothetical protein A4E65_02456 [Syntrophorhabdus sp. PtaU1.Bin153]|nr:MAG: hypothetical protein A4E65_02456 [Syntrophorhabdus sp. PtaU1.Bin153]
MRRNHRHATFLLQSGLNHVADKGIIALAFRGDSAPETFEPVRFCLSSAPFVEGERWIGHYDVELHEAVVLHKGRIGQRIAPLDASAIQAVEEHVHAGERPGAAVHLHAEEGKIPAAHLPRCLNKETAGTAGRITYAVSRLRPGKPCQKLRYLVGRVEFPGFLTRVGGKPLN